MSGASNPRGSPPARARADKHPPFVGRADPISGAVVTGWSCDALDPDRPIELSVFIDGTSVDSIACSEKLKYRPAVLNGSPGQPRAFRYEIAPQFRDGASHTIALRHSGGATVLFATEEGAETEAAAFSLPAGAEIEGFVDGLVAGGISGWAIRRDRATGQPSGGVELLVACDNEPVARITADLFRPDVGQAKGCTPNVGFNFQPPPHLRTGRAHRFSFSTIPENTQLHNSPLVTSFPSLDTMSSLHGLHDMARALCAEVWSMERRIQQMLSSGPDTVAAYDRWARRYFPALAAAVAARREAPPRTAKRRGARRPLISIVMPTFKPNLDDFKAAIESVRAQTYNDWELLIVDDCSRSTELSAYLRAIVTIDRRIKVSRHATNKGISAATNTGIARATGDYVALFDHDDLLVDVALEVMVDAAQRTGAVLLYSDEDKIDEQGHFIEPHFKPDFNWRLLLGMNYMCHLTVVKRDVLSKVGRMRGAFDGAQDHDLFLRLTELVGEAGIHHVPEVLYHWRKSPGSTAQSVAAKPLAVEAGVAAVRQHLLRRGFAGAEVSSIKGLTLYSVAWRLTDEPSVVIVIPFRDQVATTRTCLELLLANTGYGNFKVVLVDNWSQKPETSAFCAEAAALPGVSVMRVEENFNFSRLNNLAVSANPADFYVFANNDVFIRQRDWLRRLMDEALADPQVGIVGAKLAYPNRTLQHAGVVLGVGGIADHAFKGIGPEDPGYVGRALVTQQYSAVTGALMLCRASVFAAVGQFDEADLSIAFNDVDLCLKAGGLGHKVVWAADVIAEHHESLSRGADDDVGRRARFFHEHQIVIQRWNRLLANDPFYNKNFSNQGGIFRDLSDPTRSRL